MDPWIHLHVRSLHEQLNTYSDTLGIGYNTKLNKNEAKCHVCLSAGTGCEISMFSSYTEKKTFA